MPLDKKFLQEVEELIDIAHKANARDTTKSQKNDLRSPVRGQRKKDHTRDSLDPKSSAKPKSRLTKIQKAFLLSEILPRKY